MEKDKNPKTLRGYKTRMCKQREMHVIRALDYTDTCLGLADSDDPDKNMMIDILKKIRKELCKI